MEEKKANFFEKYALRGLIILVGVGLFAWGVRGLQKRYQQSSNVKDSQLEVGELLKSDLEALNNPETKPLILAQALRRLGTYRQDEGILKAKELLNHNDEMVRKAAMDVLAYDSNLESIDILISALDDKSQSIRESAISSLGKKRGSQKAVDALTSALSNNKLFSDSDKLDILKSLYNLEVNIEKRSSLLDNILEKVSSKNSLVSNRALTVSINVAPKDSRVINTLRAALGQSGDPILMATAIYHLSNIGDEWFRDKLPKFLMHKEYAVKMATLNAFPLLCPSDRWTLIKEFLRNEKDPNLIGIALRTPRHIGGSGAQDFLQALLNQTQILGEKYHSVIMQELEATESNDRKPACKD